MLRGGRTTARPLSWSVISLPTAIAYETKTHSGKKLTRYRVGDVGGMVRGKRVRRIPQRMNSGEILALLDGVAFYFSEEYQPTTNEAKQ